MERTTMDNNSSHKRLETNGDHGELVAHATAIRLFEISH